MILKEIHIPVKNLRLSQNLTIKMLNLLILIQLFA